MLCRICAFPNQKEQVNAAVIKPRKIPLQTRPLVYLSVSNAFNRHLRSSRYLRVRKVALFPLYLHGNCYSRSFTFSGSGAAFGFIVSKRPLVLLGRRIFSEGYFMLFGTSAIDVCLQRCSGWWDQYQRRMSSFQSRDSTGATNYFGVALLNGSCPRVFPVSVADADDYLPALQRCKEGVNSRNVAGYEREMHRYAAQS
jgi:hypothetical protein